MSSDICGADAAVIACLVQFIYRLVWLLLLLLLLEGFILLQELLQLPLCL